MARPHRSGCPINLTLEILGDRWSLIVIRDILFGNRRHFRGLLTQSEEGIASNILADRLKRLVDAGLLTRTREPGHRQKARYSLTESAIELVALTNPAARDVDPERFYDARFVKALEDSGYIQSLYR